MLARPARLARSPTRQRRRDACPVHAAASKANSPSPPASIARLVSCVPRRTIFEVARRPIQREKRSQHLQLVRCRLDFRSSCSRHLLALSTQHCSGVARAEQLLTVHGNQIHSVHRFQGVLELPRSDVTSLLVLHLFASGVVNQYPQFPAEGQPTCSQCPTGAEWCVSR